MCVCVCVFANYTHLIIYKHQSKRKFKSHKPCVVSLNFLLYFNYVLIIVRFPFFSIVFIL